MNDCINNINLLYNAIQDTDYNTSPPWLFSRFLSLSSLIDSHCVSVSLQITVIISCQPPSKALSFIG